MPCNALKCQWPCCTAPQRHVLIFLLFLGAVLSYTHRVNFNLAIVEMVEDSSKVNKTVEKACPMPKGESNTKIKNIQGGKFDWDEKTQGILLQGFFYGYVIGHIPAGWMADKFGARWPIFFGLLTSTLSTVLTPMFVQNFHYTMTVILRAICGFGQAVIYPGITAMLARWAPPSERSTMAGIVFAGNSIGTIVGNLISGYMIVAMESWTVVFYFWGIMCAIWLVFFWLYAFSMPRTHKHITIAELEYLKLTIVEKEKVKAPFFKIITDMKILALILGQLSHNYILFTLVTNLSKYMNNVLNYNMKSNAVASSLPYFGMYVGSVICGFISDYWISHNGSIHLVRKLFTAIANLLPAFFVLCAGYSNCNRAFAITFFSLALFFKGFFYSGLKVNALDLTANHAGLVMSLVNGCGSISGAITPIVIGMVAKDNTLAQWHMVFWILNMVVWATTGFYLVFGGAKRRKWDYKPEEYANLPEEEPHKWYHQMAPDSFEAKKAAAKEKNEKVQAEAKVAMEKAEEAEAQVKEEKKAAKAAKKAEKAEQRAGNK